MSGTEPSKIDNVGMKMISLDETQSITFKMEGTHKGILIDYDLTTTPKQFKITPSGINWTDGVSNNTTGLERLALVEQAFQSVELPPNANTLKLNDTIELNDGSNNALIGIDGSGNLLIDPSNNLIIDGLLDMSGNTIDKAPLIQNTGGTIEILGTQINLDATTIDFQNTSTTTSTSNNNANIRATSNGLETTKFLKVKLNGADIWIAYFETDPSF